MIQAALKAAHVWIGATGSPTSWSGPHYQFANRIAWAGWLREKDVDTVFAHVLFSDDRSHIPASRQELENAVCSMHRALGIRSADELDWMADIYLPAIG
jgi:hypothetical protein